MIKWFDRGLVPKVDRLVLAHCPHWCDSGYQVCKWNGQKFYYDEQPNESFDNTVQQWSLVFEAD